MSQHDSPGLHHFHRRKRIRLHHEEHPHQNKWKNLMDKFIYVIGVIGPIMTIPQVTNIWIEKNATGVSIISWTTYLLSAFFWVVYGIMHKDKPIIITYTAWIFLDLLIVIGIILYN